MRRIIRLALVATWALMIAGAAAADEAPGCAAHETGANDASRDANGVQTETVFTEISTRYLLIQEALAADSTDGVADAAAAIMHVAHGATEATAADLGTVGDSLDEFRKHVATTAKAAHAMQAAGDLKSLRGAFGKLSAPVVAMRDLATGTKPPVAYCGMAQKEWLQASGPVANPYYGSEMLRCGSIIRK